MTRLFLRNQCTNPFIGRITNPYNSQMTVRQLPLWAQRELLTSFPSVFLGCTQKQLRGIQLTCCWNTDSWITILGVSRLCPSTFALPLYLYRYNFNPVPHTYQFNMDTVSFFRHYIIGFDILRLWRERYNSGRGWRSWSRWWRFVSSAPPRHVATSPARTLPRGNTRLIISNIVTSSVHNRKPQTFINMCYLLWQLYYEGWYLLSKFTMMEGLSFFLLHSISFSYIRDPCTLLCWAELWF